MKKLTVLAFLVVVAFTSCTREYICQCKIKYSGPVPGLPDSTLTETVLKNTKAGAKANCTANSSTTTQDQVTLTQTCELY